MSAPELVRWGALGALLAAIAWTASGIIALVLVEPPATNMGPVGSLSWYLIDSSDALSRSSTDTKLRAAGNGGLNSSLLRGGVRGLVYSTLAFERSHAQGGGVATLVRFAARRLARLLSSHLFLVGLLW